MAAGGTKLVVSVIRNLLMAAVIVLFVVALAGMDFNPSAYFSSSSTGESSENKLFYFAALAGVVAAVISFVEIGVDTYRARKYGKLQKREDEKLLSEANL